jgi:MoxR-like ATPase
MRERQRLAEQIVANVERVIIGKRREVELALVALLARGHILIEDVPGVGKTMLARALARSLGCTFKRIQFTPDLLPSDITGVSLYNPRTGAFEFRPGPVMAQVVLADEINRATPKTQSALLECMEERQVSVDGTTYPVPQPFLVLATQNPIEYEGTFPLPEAQLDRFLLRLRLGYPGPEDELAILAAQEQDHPIATLEPVIDAATLVDLQAMVARTVYVDPRLRAYIVDLVQATRQHPEIRLGASPRGSLALFQASRARAFLDGRDYVLPDDIKALAEPVLAHRLVLQPSARQHRREAGTLIAEILERLPVPGAGIGRWR